MDKNFKKTAALLLGHGSRVKEADRNMMEVVEAIRGKGAFLAVEAAFLELSPPTIAEGIRACVDKGAEKIIIAPYFLHNGMHVKRDLPLIIKKEAERYPGVYITYARNIGFHPTLAEIMLERLIEAFEFNHVNSLEIPAPPERDSSARGSSKPAKRLGPAEIESESFRVILKELERHHFNQFELPIIQRIIHAAGDTDLKDHIYFHPDFFKAAREAISSSRPILTDVNMVLAGINKGLLDRLGLTAHCYIVDDGVREESRLTGLTRASLGIRKGFASHKSIGGVVVGNAPTALREVIRLHQEQGVRPEFVIAAAVGFVDAEESKEAIINCGIPAVVVRGRKGGSALAVAALNALLMLWEKFGEEIIEGDQKEQKE